MASKQKFQTFVENWPTSKEGREVIVTDIQSTPISMYIAHFDEKCEPARAEILKDQLDDSGVLDQF